MIDEVSRVRGLLIPKFKFAEGQCTLEIADAITQGQWRNGLTGITVVGMPVTVADIPREMSTEEIMGFISQHLQMEEGALGPAQTTPQKPAALKVTVPAPATTVAAVQVQGPAKPASPRREHWGKRPRGPPKPQASRHELSPNGSNVCFACKRNERPCDHDWNKCAFAQDTRKQPKKGEPENGQTKECRTCWRKGLSFMHNFLECPIHKKTMAEARSKGPRGSAPPRSPSPGAHGAQ